MTYNKPEVVLLVEATSNILGKLDDTQEGVHSTTCSYELDEDD